MTVRDYVLYEQTQNLKTNPAITHRLLITNTNYYVLHLNKKKKTDSERIARNFKILPLMCVVFFFHQS